MKKIILLLTLFVGLTGGLRAQSLFLYHEGLTLENDAEVVIFNTPDIDPIALPLVVSNFGTTDLQVKVKRYDLSMVEGSLAYFCWGVCFSSSVMESPDPLLIPLGGSENSFFGDYEHRGNEGASRVRYTFFDADNPVDSTSFIVEYQVYTINDHSFEVTLDDQLLTNNQELSVLIDPVNDPVELMGKIKNTNNVEVSVKVKKYDLSLIPNTSSNICWGVCYGSDIFETDAVMLSPGASDDSFRGDYRHRGNQGTSSVRFTVFNTENLDDSLSFIVHYQIGYLGINDNEAEKASLSNAFPNPASAQVNFEYTLPASVAKARVKITNLLGTTIYDQPLDRNDGKITIDVSNFNDGIYFYSLLLNNTATTTRKFIVKR